MHTNHRTTVRYWDSDSGDNFDERSSISRVPHIGYRKTAHQGQHIWVTQHAIERYCDRFCQAPSTQIERMLIRAFRASQLLYHQRRTGGEIRRSGSIKLVVYRHNDRIYIVTVLPYQRLG